jgi:GT2 family glycosyltransferase
MRSGERRPMDTPVMTLNPRDLASRTEQVDGGGSRLAAFPAGRHRARLERPAAVTVCVPVFNGGVTLDRCLNGLAEQTHADMDVVIVDNLSTDATFARCAAFADSRPNVTVYENASNIGRIGNWNRCLELASGRYVKFAMVNDILAPECVARFVAALDAHPSASMACSAVSIVNADGSTDGGAIFPQPTLLAGRAAIEFGLRVHNLANGPSGQLLRRSMLDQARIRFDESFSWAADWELTMQLFRVGDLVYLPEALSILDLRSPGRFHNQTFSARHFRDECRVTVRFASECGLAVPAELADAAVSRIEQLYAKHAPTVADVTRSAFAADVARTRRAVRERIGWEQTARGVFAADALRITAPPGRIDEAQAIAAAIESTGCVADVVCADTPGMALEVIDPDVAASIASPSDLPWPIDADRFAPVPRGRGTRYTFLAVLDRWDGWQAIVEAYVSEFADREAVSLALVATPAAGVTPEQMFADAAGLIAGPLGLDPNAIPDLTLLVTAADPSLYHLADCLVAPATLRRDAEAAACGLHRVAAAGDLRKRLRWAFDHGPEAAAAALEARSVMLERHGYQPVARRLAAALASA